MSEITKHENSAVAKKVRSRRRNDKAYGIIEKVLSRGLIISIYASIVIFMFGMAFDYSLLYWLFATGALFAAPFVVLNPLYRLMTRTDVTLIKGCYLSKEAEDLALSGSLLGQQLIKSYMRGDTGVERLTPKIIEISKLSERSGVDFNSDVQATLVALAGNPPSSEGAIKESLDRLAAVEQKIKRVAAESAKRQEEITFSSESKAVTELFDSLDEYVCENL